MPVKSCVPVLVVLAVAALPAADDATLKVSGVIQARALLLSQGTNAAGDPYDPLRQQDGRAEVARFGLRRARLTAAAQTPDGWLGTMTIRSVEPNNLNGTADTNGGGIQLYLAFLGRTFKAGAVEHDLSLGLQKAFTQESSISTSTLLFPATSITAMASDTFGARGAGVFYKLSHEFVRFGVSVQNNTTANGAELKDGSPDAGNPGARNGMHVSGRVEAGVLPSKKSESFAGAAGTQAVVGFDLATNRSAYTTNTTTAPGRRTDAVVLGPDFLLHHDAWSLVAEYRVTLVDVTDIDQDPEDTTRNEQRCWSVTTGYAIPTGGGPVLEPALRLQWADVHSHRGVPTANDIGANPALTENGEFTGKNSGREWAVGLNAYWNGHKIKTQLAFTESRAAVEEARTRFLTLQQQMLF